MKVGLLVQKSNVLHRKIILERFDQFFTQKNDFESIDFDILKEVVHNFGKSHDDMIYVVKKCLFPLDAYMVSCPS